MNNISSSKLLGGFKENNCSFYTNINIKIICSGCGSVGRAIASDTRGPWFGSGHRQKNLFYFEIEHLFTVNCVLKRQK